MTTPVKLKRLRPGYYTVVGYPDILVSRHTASTWSARLGTHSVTTWSATSRTKRKEDAPVWECIVNRDGTKSFPVLCYASASNLAALRVRLGKSLAA